MEEPRVPLCKNLLTYFREYCNCTSVHGFRYFGEKGRTHFERVWWFIIFAICLGACSASIYRVYKKWEKSPVIVNFANKGTQIHNIPFPAVTICPEAKSVQDIFNYTAILQRKEDNEPVTPLEDIQFDYMSLLCDYIPEISYRKNEIFSDEFFKFIDQVKPEFHFKNCSYLSKEIPCDTLFKQVLTDEGVCYSFNVLSRDEIFKDNLLFDNDVYHAHHYNYRNWSIEGGYTENGGIYTYPSRAYLAGVKNGLNLNIVTPNKDLDYACKGPLQGYRVLLHSPMNLPRLSQTYFRLPLNQNIIATIKPVVITTSSLIEKYDAAKRGCYFQEERYLKYFRNYTWTNCKLECLTNYTLHLCECVNFFMPRENGTSVCGTGNIACMSQAEEAMKQADMGFATNGFEMNCNCLPICSHLGYEVETSQSDLEWKKWILARRSLPYHNESYMSSLTIFFSSDNFITAERNELFGPIDFLANFGGLLGLFTGFSVLSMMEILYFLSVRIMCNKRLYGQWAGPKM